MAAKDNGKVEETVAQTRKVLIVEDEDILAANLQVHIRRCGWDARIAPTGRMAVSAFGEFLPHVILLDYRLPDMSGFQALDAIRTGRSACGCILMTGHPTDTVMTEARSHGIRLILCKPFALAELEGHLSSAAAASA